jgi:hypothetical protein
MNPQRIDKICMDESRRLTMMKDDKTLLSKQASKQASKRG